MWNFPHLCADPPFPPQRCGKVKNKYSKVQTNWDTPTLVTLYSPRKDQQRN